MDTSTHLFDLQQLRASHPSCAGFHEAYPHGFWCHNYSQCNRQGFDYSKDETEWAPYNGTNRQEFKRVCGNFQRWCAHDLFAVTTVDHCQDVAEYSPHCLCVPPDDSAIASHYLGAQTTPQKRALVWISRISSFLSFGGSVYIFLRYLHSHQETRRRLPSNHFWYGTF